MSMMQEKMYQEISPQIPIVRGISLITNIAKPPNRFSARKMKFPTQE